MRRYIFLISLFLSTAAYGDYTCVGKIGNINQGRTGTVSLISSDAYGDNNGHELCSLTAIWNGIDPQVCKGWLSKLLSAKAQDKAIVVQYADGTSCSSIPIWSNSYAPYAIWEAE